MTSLSLLAGTTVPTLYDLSDCDYNLSTLFDENLENSIYENATIENNVHDKSNIENNVHDLILPSMRAPCMLNLGLKKKGFKMGHLNIQGIQNKTDQVASLQFYYFYYARA